MSQNEASATTSESTMLLPHAGDNNQCSQTDPSFTQKVINYCSHLCIPSKVVVLIIINKCIFYRLSMAN